MPPVPHPPKHESHACCLRICVCLGRGSPKATGLHGFSCISYSSLPFLKTQLPSAAGAESEWPLHFTPEVASFQQWVSDPASALSNLLWEPSEEKVLQILEENLFVPWSHLHSPTPCLFSCPPSTGSQWYAFWVSPSCCPFSAPIVFPSYEMRSQRFPNWC